MLFVQLGDIDKPGQLALVQVFPGLFRAHTDAVFRRDNNHAGIHHADGLHNLTGKVKIAGVIEQIDFALSVFDGDNGGRDRIFPLDFLRIKVADGGTLGRLSQPVGSLGVVQHTFSQSGLSVSAVSNQADVSNVASSIAHIDLPLSDPEIPDFAGLGSCNLAWIDYIR